MQGEINKRVKKEAEAESNPFAAFSNIQKDIEQTNKELNDNKFCGSQIVVQEKDDNTPTDGGNNDSGTTTNNNPDGVSGIFVCIALVLIFLL